jgi:hypothetical protein
VVRRHLDAEPHLDTELLPQLAAQRLPRRLAGLDLAAGELPPAGE